MTSAPPAAPPPPTQQKSSGGGCLKALGIGCLVVIVLAIIAGVVIRIYFKTWVAAGMRKVAVAAVDQSNLPADQKKGIKLQLARVTDGLEDGSVTMEQLGLVLTDVVQGPLMSVGVGYFATVEHLKTSGLSAQEQQDATLVMQRFARGAFEGTISLRTVQDVMNPIVEFRPNNQVKPKEQVTDEDLRKVIAAAKERADEAKVPQEAYQIDIAGELKRSIDKVLGESAELTPAPEPTLTPTPAPKAVPAPAPTPPPAK